MKRFLLCLSAICVATMLRAQSGQCGPNLYWSIDQNTRTLKISGSGPMARYGQFKAPWYQYRQNIYYIVFDGSPTSLGFNAFLGLSNCWSITVPNSITSLNKALLRTSFKEIYLPASISFIEKGEFAFNFSLQAIHVDKNNPYFCSENGVLFDKSKTKLIHYPNAKSDASYTIPSTVTYVECFFNKYILSLTIPRSVVSITGDMIGEYACPNLQTIYYEDGFNPLLVYGGQKPHGQINFVRLSR